MSAYLYLSKVKKIKCPCGNTITLRAHTVQDDSSVYKFRSVLRAESIMAGIDSFGYVLCTCGVPYGTNRFFNAFHERARKEHQKLLEAV